MKNDIVTLEDYLSRLRDELRGADPALVQDAVSDATEFFRNAADAAGGSGSSGPWFAAAIDNFGSPAEIAAAYRENDGRVAAVFAAPPAPPRPGILGAIFGVFADPHAYGALFYMFFSLITGIFYFTWTVTGLSLSAGLAILIFGIPFFLAFLGSVRALAFIEGRLVETLLGVRMPRRPTPIPRGSLSARIGLWLKDLRTWSSLLYMVVQLPLGVLYFTVGVTVLGLACALAIAPFGAMVDPDVELTLGYGPIEIAPWHLPFFWLSAFLVLLVLMHAARLIGRGHGLLAKAILVRPAPSAVGTQAGTDPAGSPAAGGATPVAS